MQFRARKKRDKVKKPVLRWPGVLAEAHPKLRSMCLVVLFIISFAQVFTQLGFVGIGFNGDYVAYAVLVLLPVSLAALLFGARVAVPFGFVSGLMLYAHAVFLPLDYYELTFVTPYTSVLMLTLVALLLSISFALALRNDPPIKKRLMRIALICLFVSVLYTLCFLVMNVVALAKLIATDPRVTDLIANETSGTEEQLNRLVAEAMGTFYVRLGRIDIQMWFDAAAMALVCFAGDAAARRVIRRQNDVAIRDLFSAWLAVVVLLAFLMTSALSFVSTSVGAQRRASKSMVLEVDYVGDLLSSEFKKIKAIGDFVASLDQNAAESAGLDALSDALLLQDSTIVEGYSEEEDGTFLVSYVSGEDEGKIFLSNSSKFQPGEYLVNCLSGGTIVAINKCLETGETQRIVFDDLDLTHIDINELANQFIPTEVALLQVKRVDNFLVTMIVPYSLVYSSRAGVMTWASLTVLIVLLAVFISVARLLEEVVAKRIDETNAVLGHITQGDLDARVKVRETREFASLSDGINQTVDALKGWISEAETRMDAELATAGAIQESALPRVFPPYPDILHFDIYASMHPAKEVGGDFYDFFLIGEDSGPNTGKLGFVVADVSGKGVPAALFMMAAKTLIHDYMASGMELGEAFENVNHQLCDGNDADMFVTVFAGILDYETYHVDYVNAGHNPPLLWQNGSWQWLRKKSGLPLGIFDGLPYRAHAVDCQPGDQFLIYTDGVTEAMNVDEVQYGEERLEELVHNSYDLHPRMLIEEVRKDVVQHAVGAEQSDDITILALEVGVPPEITASKQFVADIANLDEVNEFIHTELDRRLCPMRAQTQLDVAVEELFVNVCNYAYPDATKDDPGMLTVSYTYSADPPSIKVDLIDSGVPFDPLAKPDTEAPDDIMAMPIGGLGILMAKKSVDAMEYARIGGQNIVSLTKRW